MDIPDLKNFLQHCKLNSNAFRAYSTLASPTDPIKKPAYPIILDYFKNIKHHGCATIKWTEEQKHVVTSILQNVPYQAEPITWQTGFDEELVDTSDYVVSFDELIEPFVPE